jgi:hypothetical protein
VVSRSDDRHFGAASFHIPLGTALGVYGLWVLVNDETRRLLESGGALPVAPVPYPR